MSMITHKDVLAESAMDAAVQCLYIAVDKSIADDVFARWIAYKQSVNGTIEQLEAEVARLKAVAQKHMFPGDYSRFIGELDGKL